MVPSNEGSIDPLRRRLLCVAMAGAALYSLAPAEALASANSIRIENITRLYAVPVARELAPTDAQAVAQAIRDWPGRISIGGGRYSMGGQIALEGSLHLDMRAMNALVWLKVEARCVRVQAGMRWRDLQDLLDPHGLSVRTMQSFSNFTVGGSVSVNVHGRYVGHGPIAASIRALQLVLADGSVRELSRNENAELFAAVIGGYGALGVVTEIELDLDLNERIERVVERPALADYPAWFRDRVLTDPAALMHNADLLPPLFEKPVAVTWRRTDKALTVPERLTPRDQRYTLERSVLWAMTEMPGGQGLRESVVQPRVLGKQAVVWRNHEASQDVAMLEPTTRAMTTYVLQEYFVPPRNFQSFVSGMSSILQRHGAQVLNVSIRHSPPDRDALMCWAREEVFSFVLYYKQRKHAVAMQRVAQWTRELIELALVNGGTYYLPYQLHATQDQFERAYPHFAALRALKARFDPAARFGNALWARYMPGAFGKPLS
ncbi:MAG: FAD-binding oxidoreductase [Rhodocyclaceae bacterium]